ncbi:MAG: hypothetical protein OSA23_07505 [Rhodospirillales bacterium]|nr:hypothetical protein [Rhodospirillales bacterium]
MSTFEPNGIVFGIAKELLATCRVSGFTNNGFAARNGLVKLHPDIFNIYGSALLFG